MSEDKTYNGYTNYETWNVALWIDNDEGSQEYWKEQAEQADSIYELEQELKAWHDEYMPEVSGTYADLLQSALDSVNWYEIAENMYNEITKECDTCGKEISRERYNFNEGLCDSCLFDKVAE